MKERAIVLAVLGSCLGAIAMQVGAWGWLLGWLGANFFVLAVAYFFGAHGVFGKRPNGALPWWSWVAFLPYFAFSSSVWNLSRFLSHEPASDSISTTLVVGRRLLDGEATPEFENCVDLTAEFQEPRHLRQAAGYVSFPILDAGVPDPAALKSMIGALRPGRTFVHCAQGHGRTGLVAVAILLTSRSVGSVDEGIRVLKAVRPGIQLNRCQRRCITDFARSISQMGGDR